MLARTNLRILDDIRDVDRINATCNHPNVLPFINAPSGQIDVTPLLVDPRNLFMWGQYGGFIARWSGPHVYDIHACIEPDGHGRWASAAADAFIRHMMLIGARLLWAQIPVSNRSTCLFARRNRFEKIDDISLNGQDYEVYGLCL